MSREEIRRLILEGCTSGTPSTQKLAVECLRLKRIIAEIHSWIVCAPIATAEDMMQNASRIVEISDPDFDGEPNE